MLVSDHFGIGVTLRGNVSSEYEAKLSKTLQGLGYMHHEAVREIVSGRLAGF